MPSPVPVFLMDMMQRAQQSPRDLLDLSIDVSLPYDPDRAEELQELEPVADGGEGYRKSFTLRTWEFKEPRDAYIQVVSLPKVDENGVIEQRSLPEPWKDYHFLIAQIQETHQSRVSLQKTFGTDQDVLLTFGQEPRIWRYTGHLRNESGRGDWVNWFKRLYRTRLRAEQLARARQMMRLVVGDLLVDGYMLNMTLDRNSTQDDAVVGISFNVYVRAERTIESAPTVSIVPSEDEIEEPLDVLEGETLDQTLDLGAPLETDLP